MNKISIKQSQAFPGWLQHSIPKKYILLSAKLRTDVLTTKHSDDIIELINKLTTEEHWIAVSSNIQEEPTSSILYKRVCTWVFVENGTFLLYSFQKTFEDFKKTWDIIYEPRRVLIEKTFRDIEKEKSRILP